MTTRNRYSPYAKIEAYKLYMGSNKSLREIGKELSIPLEHATAATAETLVADITSVLNTRAHSK